MRGRVRPRRTGARAGPRSAARRARAAGLGLLAVAALLADAGCSPERRHPNLLVVVVDTLRADRLSAWGQQRDVTPSLDALGRSAVTFRRAYSTAPWTKPAVASLLTGLHPSGHRVVRMGSRLPDETDTLAEMLSRVGYGTAAVVSHTLIGAGFSFHQGFGAFVQDDALGHDHVSSPGVTADAVRLLGELAADPAPFFLFVHYFDPHFAYRRHAEFGFASGTPGRLRGGEPMPDLRALDPPLDADERGFLLDSYDEEIRFTDDHIGRLLAEVERLGIADDTLVVFTADHGEEFGERGWLGHTRHLYDTLIHVPLFIRLPGAALAGTIVEAPVSLVEVLPTVLDGLGLDASELDLPARSLLPLMRGTGTRRAAPVYSEVDFDAVPQPHLWPSRRSSNMRSVVVGRHKLLHDRGTDAYELYDLVADPGEQNDLAAASPEIVARLREALDAATERAAAGAVGAQEAAPIEPEQLRMLHELGYTGD